MKSCLIRHCFAQRHHQLIMIRSMTSWIYSNYYSHSVSLCEHRCTQHSLSSTSSRSVTSRYFSSARDTSSSRYKETYSSKGVVISELMDDVKADAKSKVDAQTPTDESFDFNSDREAEVKKMKKMHSHVFDGDKNIGGKVVGAATASEPEDFATEDNEKSVKDTDAFDDMDFDVNDDPETQILKMSKMCPELFEGEDEVDEDETVDDDSQKTKTESSDEISADDCSAEDARTQSDANEDIKESTINNASKTKSTIDNTSKSESTIDNTSKSESTIDNTSKSESTIDNTSKTESTIDNTSKTKSTIDNTSKTESIIDTSSKTESTNETFSKKVEATDQRQVKSGEELSKQPSKRPSPETVAEFQEAVIRRVFNIPRPRPLGPRHASVAIVGSANAGKSTLMNLLINNKVSAVSPKRNTTQKQVIGVFSKGLVQLTFRDTPGIVPFGEGSKHKQSLVHDSWNSIQEADIVLVVYDSAKIMTPLEKHILTELKKLDRRKHSYLVLVLNKVDLVRPKTRLLPLAEKLNNLVNFDRTFMISSEFDDGVCDVRDFLCKSSIPGRWQHENDVVTDLSLAERISEIVREKIFLRLNQELPYRAHLRNDGVYRLPGKAGYRINQIIYVDCVRHKTMVIGRCGAVLDWVRTRACTELEALLGAPVQLAFDVLVKKGAEEEDSEE